MTPLLVEVDLGFILGNFISIVLIPTLVIVLMYKLFPKKKELILKILKIKKYIVFILILFIGFMIFDLYDESDFLNLNTIYFLFVPLIFTLLIMLFLEKKIIERAKLDTSLSFCLFIILTIQIVSSKSFYIDEEQYYMNIYYNGMTINNRLQKLVSDELLDKVEVKNNITAYEESKI